MLKKILLKWYSIVILVLLLPVVVLLLYIFIKKDAIQPPTVDNTEVLNDSVYRVDGSFSYVGNSWMRKRSQGMYELYVEGTPFQRGVYIGKLSQQLIQYQEKVFVEKISEYIPSDRYRRFLNVMIAVINADLPDYIPVEYQEEIYGISFYASTDFNTYGSPYQRQLNYHGAHDIGHMMQNYMLVGCSSFSVWNNRTQSEKLLTARNFDFYFGEQFSQNKIIAFVAPDKGYKFAFITWGGMIGVVSGMNEEGLSITVNAGTPVVPLSSGTPVSIMAREILQYAKNIDEAIAIANRTKLFVSESFHISSAHDSTAIIIEKTPDQTGIVRSDSTALICTNFYQSDTFENTEENRENKNRKASFYRFQRIGELIQEPDTMSYKSMIAILRNKEGLGGKDIGYGNEKAVNQLLAHHGIVFSPYDKTFWVSTAPNVIGEFVAYNLDSVFAKQGMRENTIVEDTTLRVEADTFLKAGVQNYVYYKMFRRTLIDADSHTHVTAGQMREFISLNPEYYEAYKVVGDYFLRREEYAKAVLFYEKALQKEITSKDIEEEIQQKIEECGDNY